MNEDIRLNVGFFEHPKIVKLGRKFGCGGVMAFLRLLLWVTTGRPSGLLEKMEPDDIAIAAKWEGDAAEFIEQLVNLRLIDLINGVYAIHDWEDHNSWQANDEYRSDSCRFSRMAATHKDIYNSLKAAGVKAISKSDHKRLTQSNDPTKAVNDFLTALGSPTPLPNQNQSNTYVSEGGAPLPPSNNFIPPGIDDVISFCREENLNIDSGKFVDHYNSNGWRVGGNSMQDWRASVRNWARRDFEKRSDQSSTTANSKSLYFNKSMYGEAMPDPEGWNTPENERLG